MFLYIPTFLRNATGISWGKEAHYPGPKIESNKKIETDLEVNKTNSYTPHTLHACCSQSKFRILKIRESSSGALFLYNCTPNISLSADASVSVA